jgi:hypothetical protein
MCGRQHGEPKQAFRPCLGAAPGRQLAAAAVEPSQFFCVIPRVIFWPSRCSCSCSCWRLLKRGAAAGATQQRSLCCCSVACSQAAPAAPSAVFVQPSQLLHFQGFQGSHLDGMVD